MEEVVGPFDPTGLNVTEERPEGWPLTHMWTTLDVSRFVEDVGYGKYTQFFKNNMINGRDLKNLSAFDLQRLGVGNMVDAMRLHAIIKRAANGAQYNFRKPNEPLNLSYINKGSMESKIPSAKPFYLEKPIPARISGFGASSQDLLTELVMRWTLKFLTHATGKLSEKQMFLLLG